MEYGKEAIDLEALKKEIEACSTRGSASGRPVHLVPEGSLPRFEMKAQLIKKLWEA